VTSIVDAYAARATPSTVFSPRRRWNMLRRSTQQIRRQCSHYPHRSRPRTTPRAPPPASCKSGHLVLLVVLLLGPVPCAPVKQRLYRCFMRHDFFIKLGRPYRSYYIQHITTSSRHPRTPSFHFGVYQTSATFLASIRSPRELARRRDGILQTRDLISAYYILQLMSLLYQPAIR
jgi:hypothetical protein